MNLTKEKKQEFAALATLVSVWMKNNAPKGVKLVADSEGFRIVRGAPDGKRYTRRTDPKAVHWSVGLHGGLACAPGVGPADSIVTFNIDDVTCVDCLAAMANKLAYGKYPHESKSRLNR
jgi:hypothetical protein